MEYSCGPAKTGKSISRETSHAPSSAAVLKPIQILLIEDDPEAAELVRIGLNEDPADPITVEWSPNLLHAMNRLTEPGIDVILLDLGLPELKGYQSFRAIEAAADPVIPVVILTADERSHVRQLTIASGASDYLLKGNSTSLQLRQTLRQAVQSNWLM